MAKCQLHFTCDFCYNILESFFPFSFRQGGELRQNRHNSIQPTISSALQHFIIA